LADEIAYNNHDVDDGLRAGLLGIDALRQVTLFRREHDEVLPAHPSLAGRRQIHEIVRRMINHVVADLIRTSAMAIRGAAPATIDAVRQYGKPLIGLSDATAAEHNELKKFLRQELYKHYRVLRMTNKARKVVQALFDAFFHAPELLPPEYQRLAEQKRAKAAAAGQARAVADYIAGMTDRYAILEYERLFDPAERS
jgi:dGTPase